MNLSIAFFANNIANFAVNFFYRRERNDCAEFAKFMNNPDVPGINL